MLLFWVILYLLFTVAIGFFAQRYVKSSGDFIQAGRSLPSFFNATALFALWFGSETVFGASSAFLEEGLYGVIEDPFGGVLCLLLFGLFFARKLYRLNILTIGDLYRNRFGRRIEIISGVFMLITFFGYVAAQIVALGLILRMVTGNEMSVEVSILICASIVTIYTCIGGMWAVTITDFIQSIFIVIGLVVVCIFMADAAGGTSNVLNSAPEGFYKFFPENDGVEITNWFAAWLTLGLGSLASQDIFQRVNSARSERAAVNSTFIGAFLYLLLAMLPLFVALAAKVLYPAEDFSDTQEVLPAIVIAHTPLIVQVLFFGSLLSAVLSTCSGAMLAPASILSENLIKPLSKKEYSDKQFLWILRLSVIIIAVISTLMGMSRNNIYELVGESSVLGAVSLFFPMVIALYAKKASASGAFFSMFLGMLSWLIMEFGPSLGWFDEMAIATFIPALGISIAGYYLGKVVKIGYFEIPAGEDLKK